MVDQAASASSGAVAGEGTRLGKYQLLRRLAVGGMAEIYLAKASGIEGFEKLVVLKRILPQHAASEDFVAMFLAEARLAASLHHANVAQTYDIGEAGGSYFFTMEYVHGEDLREITRALGKQGRRLPLDCALAVVLGVAAGLHHAHEKRGPDGTPLGLVHRDVSPSNVIVSHDGAVKIVDFGIAKATALRADTRGGSLKGKVSYMSPEQCRGEPLDRRSDIYAIGILLWELTTGVRLYKGENEFAIMSQVVDGQPTAPSAIVPGYPPALERVVLRALARDREQRFPTALELQAELEDLALVERLAPSPLALARLMEELFGKKEDPWIAGTGPGPVALAEGSGMREPARPSRWGLWVALAGTAALAAAATVVVAGTVAGTVSATGTVSGSASAWVPDARPTPKAPPPEPPAPPAKTEPPPAPRSRPRPRPPELVNPPPVSPPKPPTWDPDSALPPPSR